MKKSIVVVVVALFSITSIANAQFLSFGLKGGLTSSNVKFDKTTFTSNANQFIAEQGNSKFGFQLGFFGRVKVLNFFIQPELLFSHSQSEVKLTDVTANKVYSEAQKFNKVDIPVIVGFKFGPAHLGLGPVASFSLSEKDGLRDKLASLTSETTTNNFKNATFGYQVGAGLDILKKITLDVRYEGGLGSIGSGITLDGNKYKFDQRKPQWVFSAGIFF
jgi:hypothetical protein